MQQERESQTIYFKDLLFRALYQWKTALIVGVVLALILGGVGLIKFKDTVDLGSTVVDMTPENEEKIALLTLRVETTQQNLERQKQYVEESVLMQINPYELYTAGFHATIYPESMMEATDESGVLDVLPAIIRVYQSAMTDTETMEEMAQSLNMQSEYLSELVYIDTSVAGVIGFSFRGRTLEEAKKIAYTVQEVFVTKGQQISAALEPHTVKIVPFERGPRRDASLQESQAAALQKVVSLTNTLNSLEKELERLSPSELLVNANTFDVVVYVLIGGVLGVALIACCAWVAHISGAKVYSAKALSGSTGIGVLGCIPSEKKYDPVTKWLRKLEGRSVGTGCEALAGDIRNRCKDGKNLLVLGQYAQSTMEELTEALAGMGIQCTLCGTTEDPAAFDALPQCDAVLLAETCMDSCYDGVQRRMQTVADYQKPLLGCVLIDG